MKARRIIVSGLVALAMLTCTVPSMRSADRETALDADDFKRVVKDTLSSKKLPKEIAVSSGDAYYGKVRMFAVGTHNTFTFWVYGSSPPPIYNAYTFTMSDPSGETMRKAVMYAVRHQATVGVFADDAGQPTWIVVYP